MRKALILLCVLRAIHLCLSFNSALPNAFAEGKSSAAAPLAVTMKGEKLIQALTTTNPTPIRIYTEDKGPLVSNNFDWQEYARVREAIRELDANALEVFPSIVEHMTDKDYCFTVNWYDVGRNHSRGDVCYEIARRWVNRAYTGLLPLGDGLRTYQAPNDMQPSELRDWLRERYNSKLLYEIQIEAGEWGRTYFPKQKAITRLPKELQDSIISKIDEKIVELRNARRPFPGSYFVIDLIRPYAENEFQRQIGSTSPDNQVEGTRKD